jgi:hypothetical protein
MPRMKRSHKYKRPGTGCNPPDFGVPVWEMAFSDFRIGFDFQIRFEFDMGGFDFAVGEVADAGLADIEPKLRSFDL